MEAANPCGIIILAGGKSSRLGCPKQLLPFRNLPLILHTIQVALDANCGPILVVTGANSRQIRTHIATTGVEQVYNPGWQEGMASSLRKGLNTLLTKYPATKMVIFMVCDQPFVTKAHLLCLIEHYLQTGKKIVASTYAEKTGTPALFDKGLFAKLLQLQGDKGAKMLIASLPKETEYVALENGELDIDTPEDYERLLKFEPHHDC